jgi:hypothetical protein
MLQTRRLNRPLARRCHHYLTTRTNGLRWTPPNYLAQACQILGEYVRLRQRMARDQPHLYGRHASRYYRDTLQEIEFEAEMEVAIRKAYGPPKPGEPPPGPGVWTRRYVLDPQWRGFRKWFHERYGD